MQIITTKNFKKNQRQPQSAPATNFIIANRIINTNIRNMNSKIDIEIDNF